MLRLCDYNIPGSPRSLSVSTCINSAFRPSGVGKWVPASAGKAKTGMVHSVSGWTRGVQVKLWDPLRTRAIPERLRQGAIQIHVYLLPLSAHLSWNLQCCGFRQRKSSCLWTCPWFSFLFLSFSWISTIPVTRPDRVWADLYRFLLPRLRCWRDVTRRQP